MAVASDSPCMPLVLSLIAGNVAEVDGSDERAPKGVVRDRGSKDWGGGGGCGGAGGGGIDAETGVGVCGTATKEEEHVVSGGAGCCSLRLSNKKLLYSING